MKSSPNLDKILHKILKRNPEQHLKILLTSHLEEESTVAVDQQKRTRKLRLYSPTAMVIKNMKKPDEAPVTGNNNTPYSLTTPVTKN